MKVTVIGPKGWDVRYVLERLVDELPRETQYITAARQGPSDLLCDVVRERAGIPVKRVPIPSGTHEREIFIQHLSDRNREMVALSDFVVVLEGVEDRGCREVLELACRSGKPAFVIPGCIDATEMRCLARAIGHYVAFMGMAEQVQGHYGG